MSKSPNIPEDANPRNYFTSHKERGPKKFTYTFEDLARASKCEMSYVRGTRRYNPARLVSVAGWILRGLGKKSELASPEQVVERFCGWRDDSEKRRRIERWEARWPRVKAFLCARYREDSRCEEILLFPGLCKEHGGTQRSSMKMDGKGYFVVLTEDKYIPFHRFMIDCPVGMDVHHIDFNKWNNRRENLKPMLHEDHLRLHQTTLNCQPNVL